MASDGSGASRGQAGGGSGGSNGPGGVVVETRDKFSVFCSWKVAGYAKIRQRAIWSNYFEVGGYDCRLLIYPGGEKAHWNISRKQAYYCHTGHRGSTGQVPGRSDKDRKPVWVGRVMRVSIWENGRLDRG